MELDTIDISGLAFDSVIGVYPSERVADQRVLLDVSLGLDTRPAALGDLARSVDYARLRGELTMIMRACRFQLLETAAEALCRYILAPPLDDRAQVQRVSVRLGKPAVSTSLRVTREASEYTWSRHAEPWGWSQIVFQAKDAHIFRFGWTDAPPPLPADHLLLASGTAAIVVKRT